MQPPSPSTVSLVLGLFGIAAALVGHYLTRRGKRDEIREQRVAQAFEERSTAFEQVSALADRYKQDADYQRDMRKKDRDEWEARWERQMNRCRKITDAASATITEFMRQATPAQRNDAEQILDDIDEHRQMDHEAS